ncbi:MAG: class I adenylate-forming enzyme family protein [Prevotella sp.]
MYEHSPLLQAVMQNTLTFSGKTAIIMNGCEVSYADLGINIRKAASVIKNMGLQAGDRVILSAHKNVEYVYLYFAAHILGVTNVIVDAESNKERLRFIENKIQPACCFGYKSSDFPSKLFEELELDNAIELFESTPDLASTDIAEILFTTGTTGDPKGVCLSYNNIYSSASNINGYIGNLSDDIELLGLPICHSFGMGRIRCTLMKGATIVILGNFANVRAFLNAFEQYHITGFGVVPAAWAYIRKMSGTRIAKYAEQIKYIEIGSAAMPLDTKKEMLEMFPNSRICMHYGLTEASRNCFQEFHDTGHLDSIGKPVCNKVDVKIFNENGLEAACGESGEICVKGNMVMSRYLDFEDTRNAFYGEYFRTGDCGYINEDGYIYLLGREKELINVGGKKVSPMEVEDAIMALGVGDCVCVPMKDEKGIMGELVFCYIKKGSTTMTFDEIASKLSEKLEVYKRPVGYDWIERIPMTSSGKKQRVKIK